VKAVQRSVQPGPTGEIVAVNDALVAILETSTAILMARAGSPDSFSDETPLEYNYIDYRRAYQKAVCGRGTLKEGYSYRLQATDEETKRRRDEERETKRREKKDLAVVLLPG